MRNGVFYSVFGRSCFNQFAFYLRGHFLYVFLGVLFILMNVNVSILTQLLITTIDETT